MVETTTSLVRPLTRDDIDWAVERLEERRAKLRPFAPRYWAKAPDAAERHAAYLRHLVVDGGGLGFRTDRSVLIAAPRRGMWDVDDAAVTQWATDGMLLWLALAQHARGEKVRMVCPVPEYDRLMFARFRGLALVESWWHLDVDPTGEPPTSAMVDVAGTRAEIVTAPPVYAPGGPLLFLKDPRPQVLAVAPQRAAELGCVLVVASQTKASVGEALEEAGFTQHGDFCEGILI